MGEEKTQDGRRPGQSEIRERSMDCSIRRAARSVLSGVDDLNAERQQTQQNKRSRVHMLMHRAQGPSQGPWLTAA